MNNKEKGYILIILFMILGMVISMQIRSVLKSHATMPTAAAELDELKKIVDDKTALANKLEKSVKENEALQEEYFQAMGEDNSELKRLHDLVKLNAGFIDVKGPGLIVTLNDAEIRKENVILTDIIIHDKDLVKVLNELKIAGAQAISINGERVMPMSEQVCAGPTVRINKNRYPVPYEIRAIGDPEIMYKTLDESDIVAELREYDIRVELTKAKEVLIQQFIPYNNSIDSLISGLEVVKQ